MITERDLAVIRRVLDDDHPMREVVLEWTGLRVEASFRTPGESSVEQPGGSAGPRETIAPGPRTAIRAPSTGRVMLLCGTGTQVAAGEPLARIVSNEQPLAVRAPFTGVVVGFFQSEGAFIERDALICLFESLSFESP